MIQSLLLVAALTPGVAPYGDSPEAARERARLAGSWQVVSLIDDGETVPMSTVRNLLVKDGRIQVWGNTISLTRPDNSPGRQLTFGLDPSLAPRTLDLSGSAVLSKGIYVLDGDTLLLCFAPPGDARPDGFASTRGSNRMFMTLNRVRTEPVRTVSSLPGAQPGGEPGTLPRIVPAPAPGPVQPPVEVGPPSDAEMRRMLIGTWGLQTDEFVSTTTYNSDGSFSSDRTWKRGGFRRVFHNDVRSSGTWRLEEGVIIARITTSTARDSNGQVFSARIRSITPRELLLIDNLGRVSQEWRTR